MEEPGPSPLLPVSPLKKHKPVSTKDGSRKWEHRGDENSLLKGRCLHGTGCGIFLLGCSERGDLCWVCSGHGLGDPGTIPVPPQCASWGVIGLGSDDGGGASPRSEEKSSCSSTSDSCSISCHESSASSPALAEEFPNSPSRIEDAAQSHESPRAELRREARRTQASLEHDSANASFKTLCTVRRLFLVLGIMGLLVGMAVGAWLLVKHLKKPQLDQDFPVQEPDMIPACSDGEEEDPVVRGAPSRVSFRINVANSLLEVQVEGQPGWLLACHEHWSLSLGTLLCQRLGYLRMTHQKGVNLTDIKVNNGQEFVQVRPHQEGSLEDLWQVRSSCESGRIVALKCSECGLRPGAARVVGGTDVSPGRWPWQVSLYHGSQHHCGGSVLAREWIVTAAHCVHRKRHNTFLLSYRHLRASSWLVFAGIVTHSSIKQEAGLSVKKIIYHPLYNDSSLDYDVALLKLQVPLNFSDAIRAVCLPPSHQDFFQGTQCWVSGWGYTSPDQAQLAETLKEAPVPLIGTKRCNSSCVYAGELTARMLCAGYLRGQTDACQGDSGGPLVCRDELAWRLVGIVSWGRGCAQPNRPGVYTNVAQLLPWIHRVAEIY